MKFVVCATLLTSALSLPAVASNALSSGLLFEPNRGQAPFGIDFVARTPEAVVQLRPDGALLSTGSHPVRLKLNGGRGKRPVGLDRLPGISNYFFGNDPDRWRTSIPHFAKVQYSDVYPGIDLVYYGNDGRLEYDFVVAPGVDPRVIEMAFDGASSVSIDAAGDLLIAAGDKTIRQLRPRVYQWDRGRKVEVAGSYRISTEGDVRLALGRYNRSRELVIDPVIQYATFVGRGGQDSAVGVAVDAAGNAFITGETTSGELATADASQQLRAGDQDAFVAKISPTGAVLFISYLGGGKTDTGLGIAVDTAGNPYVCGTTSSLNFPARGGAFGELAGGNFDAFVVKLNSTGSELLYGSYLGGSALEWPGGIAVDLQNRAWVTGWTTSRNFPVQRAYQSASAGGGEEVFLSRLSATGQTLTYSTYFGGGGRDLSTGIAVDDAGSVYVTGATTSPVIPLSNAVHPRPGGAQDAFVFRLDPETNTLAYSTFLGGSGEDVGIRLALDSNGNAHVIGYTTSTDFPVTRGVFQERSGGGTDVFAAKLSPAGAIEYATYLGGSAEDWAGGVAADAAGSMYISGWTNSPNFPVRSPLQSGYAGGNLASQRYDGIVARLSPNGDDVLYSTYLGGRGEDKAYAIALDRAGNVIVAGSTTSPNFPGASGEFTQSGPGVTDAFVARISADTSVSALGVRPASLQLNARAGDSAVPPQTLTLSSTGSTLTYSTSSDATWLKVLPQTGSTPASLTVAVDASTLPAGTHTGRVTIRTAISTVTVPVTVNVTFAPAIVAVTPSPVPRADHDVTISITGGGYTQQSYVEINGQRAETGWIDSRNLRAIVPGVVARQQGALSLVVVNPDARSNTFNLQVVSGGPTVVAGGVIHGASRTVAASVAPGQIVIVSGTGFGGEALISSAASEGRLPSTLSGTRVLFDDVPAPILWAQPGQVALLVPYSVSRRVSTQLVVEAAGLRAAPVTLGVTAAAPGLFTIDNSGTGQAAAYNENGSSNMAANPASKGSILVLYGTGEGLLSPQVADGAIIGMERMPQPETPLAVTIGGMPAEILYAGSAPGQVAGLVQLNVRIPFGAPSGVGVPVVVTSGTASSRTGVTIAIQ